MTIPNLTRVKFFEYLEKHGYKVVSNDFFYDFNRVVLSNENGKNFPIQLRDVYFYPLVCRTCERLEIPPPEDHKKVYDQIRKYRNKKED